MKEKWWIVDDGLEMTIVSSGVEPMNACRGPFEFYLEAEEWAERWERKQRSKDDIAYFMVVSWSLLAVFGIFYWLFL